MVSWIKNTASVTASLCMALSVPMVGTTFAQDKLEKVSGAAESSPSLNPEVRPISLEVDTDLQRAVSKRAELIAAGYDLNSSELEVQPIELTFNRRTSVEPTTALPKDDTVPDAAIQPVQTNTMVQHNGTGPLKPLKPQAIDAPTAVSIDASEQIQTESTAIEQGVVVSELSDNNFSAPESTAPITSPLAAITPPVVLAAPLDSTSVQPGIDPANSVDEQSLTIQIEPGNVENNESTTQHQNTSPRLASLDLPSIPPVQNIEANQPMNDGQAFPAATAQSPDADAPTVIIRPPAEGHLDGCEMEINKIEDNDRDEYAISLQVPDSVKVIEVVPSQTVETDRNFRLRLDQGTETPVLQDIAPKGPKAIQASTNQRPASREAQVPDSMPAMPQLRALPTETSKPGRKGFQQNPFFKRNLGRQQDVTAMRLNSNAGSQLVKNQATHRTIRETATQPAAKNSVFQVTYNSTNPSNKPIVAVPYTLDDQSAIENLPSISEPAPMMNVQISGPQLMAQGSTGDFAIRVWNLSDSRISNVNVVLDLPVGMDVVVLDRHAWTDQKNRTITWRLSDLVSGAEALIQYRVQATRDGMSPQRVQISAEGFPAKKSQTTTNVLSASRIVN